MVKKIFFRWCDICGKRFDPEGKRQKLCKDCRFKIKLSNLNKLIASKRINVKFIKNKSIINSRC